jgi:predicted kinase
MFALAHRVLAAGRPAVLDAVFLQPGERDAARGVAQALGVPFRGAWLEGAAETLRARLAARQGDASDAGPATLAGQLAHDPGPIDWLRLPAADLDAAAQRILDAAAWN